MASIVNFFVSILGVLWGLVSLKKNFGTVGAIVSVVIGAISIYIMLNVSDILLTSIGGFKVPTSFAPSDYAFYSSGGYYSTQALSFLALGAVLLAVYYFLLKEVEHLGSGFMLGAGVLLISGSVDLILDTLIRNTNPVHRLAVSLFVLVVVLAVAYVYRGQIFKKQDA